MKDIGTLQALSFFSLQKEVAMDEPDTVETEEVEVEDEAVYPACDPNDPDCRQGEE